MPNGAAREPLGVRREPWAKHISVQADNVEHKMKVAAAALSPLTDRHQKSMDAITGLLDLA
jgi:hypothetical protein